MRQIEQFTAKMVTLREILADPNYYAIPDMQRDYQWDIDSGKKHARQLWENIVEFIDEDPNRNDCYYMGTMITYKENSKWMIIDGQQRLTTLSLLFIAARDIFDEKTAEGVKTELKLFGDSYKIKEIGRKLGRQTVGTSSKPKLLPKESSKDNFKAFMAYLVPLGTRGDFRKGRRAKLRVVQAYEMFQKEMANEFDINTENGLQELLEFLEHILDGLAINLTEVNDLAQGYRIFSSENTTGLKLGNLDIVRALILAQVDRKKMGKEDLEDIKYQLGLMMQALEPLSKSNQGNFIRHYWIMTYGTPMNKTKLSNSIANDVKKLTDGLIAIKFVRKLTLAARRYATNVVAADSKQKYYIPHNDLINCGFKQYRPLLLALVSRKDITSEDFSKIFHIIETVYVRFLLVGRQKASLLEPVFATWSKEALDESKTPHELILKWVNDASKIEEKFNFVIGFAALKLTDKKKVKYILSKIELKQDRDVSEKNLLNALVEAILPQVKDSTAWSDTWPSFSARDHADYSQNSIGNYVIMHEKSGLGIEANWETKKEFFTDRAIYISTQQIAKLNSNWNKSSIRQNSMNRAKIAENIWALDTIITP